MNAIVSVIIPNYNHESFLKKRIDSVLNQTFQNFELIILDDCSTDNSRDIIELYRGKARISNIVYNEINSGSPFKQWEKGIQMALGKYIWIAESDDYCDEAFLESALKALQNNNHAIHYCQSYNVDENDNIVNDNFWWTENITSINWCQPFYMDGKDFINKALQFKCVIPNASAVVFLKKEVDFNKLNNYKNSGDWIFWIEMLLASGISYSNEILNNFRSHSNTTRSLTTHKKYILRHFEALSIKHVVCNEYHLGEKAELNRFLKVCIDICSIYDITFFTQFCKKFSLPKKFVLQFLIRKLLVNRYNNKINFFFNKKRI